MKDISETFELSDSDQTNVYLSAIEKTTKFSKNALTYISGFVQRKILKKETCLGCHDFLSKSKIKSTCKFIDSVNRGGLIHPSSNLNLIVKVTNSCIEEIKEKHDIFSQKSIVQKIQRNVMSILDSRHPNLFSSLDSHVDKECLEKSVSHRVLMMKKIILCFTSLRLKHMCKENNDKMDKRFKRKSLKLIHFENQ